MAKRNKRIRRHSLFAVGSAHLAVLIVTLFSAVMFWWWVDSSCTSIGQDIGTAERELAALDAELDREMVSFSHLTTPEKLELALKQHGLDMNLPMQDQIIRVNEAGRIVPGQLSVARARRRNGGDGATAVAKVKGAGAAPGRVTGRHTGTRVLR